MIVACGVGFDVLCMLYVNSLMFLSKSLASSVFVVIFTVYVSYLLCGGLGACRVSL